MAFQKNAAAARRFGRLMKFGAWVQGIPNKVTPPPFRLIQIGSAFWQSRALHVATLLDIASLLGDEALACEEIARRAGADAQAVYRLLRLLAALGVFEETSPQVFKNNALSKHLRQDHPKSVRNMVLMHNSAAMSRPWMEQLENGVRGQGVPFELAHGQALYDYMDAHAEFDALFSSAMDSVEALAGNSFATDFDWGRFERLIDVGGSKGSKSVAILQHWPKLRALVFDRPQVIASTPGYWADKASPDVRARMDWQAGNLLESVPAAASDRDIYLLSAVLHGLDDAQAATVLRHLRGAAANFGARVALLEMVVPELKADLASASFDLQMFMGTRGRERRLSEWQPMLQAAGWKLEELVQLRSIAKLLLLSPA